MISDIGWPAAGRSGALEGARQAAGSVFSSAVGVPEPRNLSGILQDWSMPIVMAIRGPKISTERSGKKKGSDFLISVLLKKYKSIY